MKGLQGTIISTKMKETVVVKVEHLWRHPIYNKRIKRSKTYLAHTTDTLKEGQIVTIAQCKPISKRKNWKIVEVAGK